jgi:hypothetical protein
VAKRNRPIVIRERRRDPNDLPSRTTVNPEMNVGSILGNVCRAGRGQSVCYLGGAIGRAIFGAFQRNDIGPSVRGQFVVLWKTILTLCPTAMINVVNFTRAFPKSSMVLRRIYAALSRKPYFFSRQKMRAQVFAEIKLRRDRNLSWRRDIFSCGDST